MGVYGEKGMSCPRVEYSYTYQTPPGGREGQEESLEIKLRCPRISSFRWCLKLYSLVLAALGLLLSFIWVCFQVNASESQCLNQMFTCYLFQLGYVANYKYYLFSVLLSA